MNTYIALFRGINVGGHRILPMKDLRSVLTNLGLEGVRTYLQSGNAVFRSSAGDRRSLIREIGTAVEKSHHFVPDVLVLSVGELQAAIAANPFPEGKGDPKSLHLSFLESQPDHPDLKKLESVRAADEKFELLGAVFYLYAPGGIGRSRLASKVEKVLDVVMTGRNWRSVNAVMAMALEMENQGNSMSS